MEESEKQSQRQTDKVKNEERLPWEFLGLHGAKDCLSQASAIYSRGINSPRRRVPAVARTEKGTTP